MQRKILIVLMGAGGAFLPAVCSPSSASGRAEPERRSALERGDLDDDLNMDNQK